jgi:UDPglucose 6-dehydrogenase
MREAPSLVLINEFIKAGATVSAYDPASMEETHRRIGDTITYMEEPYTCLQGADCLVLVTEWQEFRFPDLEKMKGMMKQHVVFDGRNIYDMAEMQKNGFAYYCIGIDTNRK